MKQPKLKLKGTRGKLTELQRIQLLYPFIASGIPAFKSEAHRRRAWDENREALMIAAAPGTRPVGWWDYESPEPFAGGTREQEREQLRRMGQLRPNELANVIPISARKRAKP
jgi:hypothetical protein